MSELFVECGHASVNKHGEHLCGDSYHITVKRGKVTIVLSDGLGSGVKAHILSTLTSTILSTLMARNMPLEECVRTVASTLPMCKERKLAYSTFTVAQIDSAQARLVQYDNPSAIFLRDGQSQPYDTSVSFVGEKEIHESSFYLQENDLLFLMTDGVTNAGIGKTTQEGWPREEVISFLTRVYKPELSAQQLAGMLVKSALALFMDSADDDTTVLVIKLRKRQAVNVIIGPPKDREDDNRVLRLFFAKDGKHVVCGGTTAHIVSRYLGKPIVPIVDSATPTVPATATIEGVDLVTEGVITLQQVVELAEKYIQDSNNLLSLNQRQDGVAQLAAMLFEQATDITIFQGQAVNPEHDELGIGSDVKAMLVKRLVKCLEEMGKDVKVSN